MATDLALPSMTGRASAPVNVSFADLVAEGLRIQHRFAAEPVYGRTGKGFLRPSGVDEIADAKASEQAGQLAKLRR
jgi:hypothetical protein